MLFELTIVPITSDKSIRKELGEAIKLIEESGFPYVVTPASTCIEGTWDAIMPLLHRCHERVRQLSPHVMTTISIEDEEGETDMLDRNVCSIAEELAGV